MARLKKEAVVGKAKSGLLEKLIGNSNSDMISLIEESSFFNDIKLIPTDVPILNIAFSGKVDGGFHGGLHTIAGPSKHFKSSIALILAKAFQNYHKDGIVDFKDSEGGITVDYLKTFDIDTKRVLHSFVTDIEQLKATMVPQLEVLEKGDPVMYLIDSIGNLSSKREYDNAMEGKTAADMTRAKELKSFTRLINGKLKIKNIPCIAINHSYQTLEMYSKTVVGGGTGMVYSSDNIWIIGRQQIKGDGEVEGYNFTITIDKSRLVKEKSKFNITVLHDGGIQRFSGLAEIAEDLGIIEKTRGGKSGKETAYRFDDMIVTDSEIGTDEGFWNRVFTESKFKELVEQKYKLGGKSEVASKVEVEE